MFKAILKNIVPVYFERKRLSNSRFIGEFKKWKRNNNAIPFDQASRFDCIVSVQGFGYSGSGAVVDLLREYDSCFVYGSADKGSSLNFEKNRYGEFDFLRFSGGLFELERYVTSRNVFINSEAIDRLVSLISNSTMYRYNEKSHPIFYSFLDRIIEDFLEFKGPAYNRHLHKMVPDISYIYFIRSIDINDYRILCRHFLYTLINVFAEPNKRFFVADQICTDFEFDYKRYLDYIPNLKMIVVYRDPRDIFIYANNKNIKWIAHNNTKLFINWLSRLCKSFDISSKDYLVVKFEKLVCQYEIEKSGIEEYIGLPKNTNSYRHFDPEVSKKNINLWEKSNLEEKDLNMIKDSFSFLC